MNKEIYWIWFSNLPKMGHSAKPNLLNTFENAENIYNCTSYSHLDYLSVKDKTILMNKKLDEAKQIYEDSMRLGIQIITFDSPLFPSCLREISNPPYVLYAKGNLPDFENSLLIGVVGTRGCTDYGIAAAKKLSSEFAEYGVITVSGMARGIDSAVALSTIQNGGKTIAVLGSGLDICYPPENHELMDILSKDHLLLSEFPPGTPPIGHNFPVRNRIISGISRGILVIESNLKGGSLITANLALEQGRDVFAVPGSIFNKSSEGTNSYISQGYAKSVSSAMDILAEYSHEFTFDKASIKEQKPKTEINDNQKIKDFEGLSPDEEKIARLLLSGPMHADEIARITNLNASELNTTLSMLEFCGKIERESGNTYKLKI